MNLERGVIRQIRLQFDTFAVGDTVLLRGACGLCDGVVIPRPDVGMCWHDVQRRAVLDGGPDLVFVAISSPPSWNWVGWNHFLAHRLEHCDETTYPINMAELSSWQQRWREEAARARRAEVVG